MWYAYKRKYYTTLKSKDISIRPLTWLNPENTLNEISQIQTDKYMIPLV